MYIGEHAQNRDTYTLHKQNSFKSVQKIYSDITQTKQNPNTTKKHYHAKPVAQALLLKAVCTYSLQVKNRFEPSPKVE